MSEHILSGAANDTIFEQRLQARRSLSASQFRTLMILLSCAASLTTLPFFLLGAWPIVGFMGLDVLLIYLAFRSNFRGAKAYELVRLDALALTIEKVNAGGKARRFSFNPRWVKLHLDQDEDFGLRHLAVEFRTQRVELGGFLAPVEREDFARSFRPALARAQRGAIYDYRSLS